MIFNVYSHRSVNFFQQFVNKSSLKKLLSIIAIAPDCLKW